MEHVSTGKDLGEETISHFHPTPAQQASHCKAGSMALGLIIISGIAAAQRPI
jgi:hypothetical protein